MVTIAGLERINLVHTINHERIEFNLRPVSKGAERYLGTVSCPYIYSPATLALIKPYGGISVRQRGDVELMGFAVEAPSPAEAVMTVRRLLPYALDVSYAYSVGDIAQDVEDMFEIIEIPDHPDRVLVEMAQADALRIAAFAHAVQDAGISPFVNMNNRDPEYIEVYLPNDSVTDETQATKFAFFQQLAQLYANLPKEE